MVHIEWTVLMFHLIVARHLDLLIELASHLMFPWIELVGHVMFPWVELVII